MRFSSPIQTGPSEAARLDGLLEAAPAGAVIELAPGRYDCRLSITKPVVVRGVGQGVVLAPSVLAAVTVLAPVEVVLEGLVLEATQGVGLVAGQGASVTLHRVELAGGAALESGAGGITAVDAEVLLDGCVVRGARGFDAGAIFVGRNARVTLLDSTVEGAATATSPLVRVAAGGELSVRFGALYAAGGGAALEVGGLGAVAVVERSIVVGLIAPGDGGSVTLHGVRTSEAPPSSVVGDRAPPELDVGPRRAGNLR
jgi:hypothetical protein